MTRKKILVLLWPLLVLSLYMPAQYCITVLLSKIFKPYACLSDFSWFGFKQSSASITETFMFILKGCPNAHDYAAIIATGGMAFSVCQIPVALFMICLLGSYFFWFKKPCISSALYTLIITWGLCGIYGMMLILFFIENAR